MSVIKVEWEFEADWDEVFKDLLMQQLEVVRQELSTVRCPVHGEPPTLIVRGHSSDEMSVDVKGCCDQLKAPATAKLKELGFEKDS